MIDILGNRVITLGVGGSSDYLEWNKILSQTADNSASVDFENFPVEYNYYKIIIRNAIPVDNDVTFWQRLKLNGSYLTSGYQFNTGCETSDIGNSVSRTRSNNNDSKVDLTQVAYVGNNHTGFNGEITFGNIDSPKVHPFQVTGDFVKSNGVIGRSKGSSKNSTEATLQGIRFLFASGNIKSGLFAFYGADVT